MIDTYLTINDTDGGGVRCFIYISKISHVKFEDDAAHIVMDNGHTNILKSCTPEIKAELLNMLKGNVDAQT